MKLSIVTTMYYSAPYIKEFYERTIKAAQKITEDIEIIFVNDGSPDNSLEVAVELFNQDNRVKVVDLSRNFGHHKAMMTGLTYANGDYIFLIDSDLEEEPELLNIFWDEMHNSNDIDVIYGVQEKRKGKLFEKITGNLFYKIFNFFSDIKVPTNLVTCRLMKKNYVKALLSFQEQEIFMCGLWAATGFIQKPLEIKKLHLSPSTYNFRKKVHVFINSLTSFSSKPLMYIFYLGFFISCLSVFAIMYFLIIKFFIGINVSGWASIFISLWFIGGLIIFSIGVIGIYLSKIFMEVKNRPYTIVKRFYNKDL